MAQDYTMTAAGLSPATSPEYRAAFTRASRLFALSQRRPGGACTQGAATILSEDIEPGEPRKPIPCIYPEKMPRPYGPATGFDLNRDYADLGDIAWTRPTRDTVVIHYRGPDGGDGTVRLPMPLTTATDREKDEFVSFKTAYLAKLVGGSGTIDTRSVAQALRDEASDDTAPKARRPRAKTAAVPTEAPPTAAPSAELDAMRAALARVTEERDELRAEVARLTADLTEARTAADTDEADLVRAAVTIADLRAEVAGLRALRTVPRFTAPPPVVRA